MKVYLGVDLGSAGTKAVLLDSEGRRLGAGRAPTGADYGEALESARRAARREARVELVRRMWSRGEARVLPPILKSFREAIAREMERRFREDVLRRLAETLGGRMDEGEGTWEGEALGEAGGARTAGGMPAGGLRRILERIREAAVRMAPRRRIPAAELVDRVEEAARAAERALYRADPEDLLEQAADWVRLRLRGRVRKRWERAWRHVAGLPLDEAGRKVTGYGRHVNAWAGAEVCSELVCHARGARWLYPATLTVLDIGGQDMKAIQLGEAGEIVRFRMNDRCAAGCGRFLTYVGEELGVAEEDLGPRALRARRGVPVSSVCTVFAGAEAREHWAEGSSVEEILRGLHEAVVERALALVDGAGGPRSEFTLTGGGAHNRALGVLIERAIRKRGRIRVNVPREGVYVGALGAAVGAWWEGTRGC